MTGEWHNVSSALSTDELPAEVVTESEDSCDGDEGGHRRGREEEEDNDQRRHQRGGGGEGPTKVWGDLDVGGVRADSAHHQTGREKGKEGLELGLGSVPPSTRSTQGTTATERWRSANQRRLPRDREPPLTEGHHGRDGCRLDKGADGDNPLLVRAPVVSQGEGAGEGGGRGGRLPPSVAVASAATRVRPEAQQAAAAAEQRRAPCHDGLVTSRGCGDTATSTAERAVASEGAASSSPGGMSRGTGRRRRRGENGAVDDDANGYGVSNSVADAADAAAKRAAAAEALNGLRLRGRIPPVRRGGGGGGRGAAATRGRGEGGGAAAAGGRKSPSLLSVTVSVASEASSSLGEQYGSSFEEDTEGSSSCSAAGSGGGGGGGGWGPESASGAPPTMAVSSSTLPERKHRLKGGSGGGGGGEQGVGYFVMTPGSVVTETTATPSSAGVAPSSRSGTEHSSGGGGGGGCRLDRTPFPSGGSSAGSAGSACGGDVTPQAAPAPHGGAAGNEFAATALSFRRAAGCFSYPASSERVSSSSWTLSGGASSSFQGSREVVDGAYGAEEREGKSGSSAMKTPAPGDTPEAPDVRGCTPPVRVAGSRATAGAASSSPRSGVAAWGLVGGDGTGRLASWTGNRGNEVQEQPPPPPSQEKWGVSAGVSAGVAAEVVRGGEEGKIRGENIPVDGDGHDGCSPARQRRRRRVREVLLHASDAQVTPIVGSRSVDSAGFPSASPSRFGQLPFEPLLPATVSAMPPPKLEAHLTVAYNALAEASAPVRQRGQTLVYLQSLAPIPRVSNLLVNSTFLVLLLR